MLDDGYALSRSRLALDPPLSAEIVTTDDFLNTYTYDSLNRLTQIDQGEQSGGNTVAEKRVDFTYTTASQFDTIARYNDTDGLTADEVATSTYDYDTLNRITDLEYENGGTDLFTPYEWSYDFASRVTQFVSAEETTDYEYDKMNQLTDADHTYQTDETYSFDANGNRNSTGYSTGSDNRLDEDGTYSYEYDDEGNRNLRTDDSTYEETEYEWDFRNRLTKVEELDDYPLRPVPRTPPPVIMTGPPPIYWIEPVIISPGVEPIFPYWNPCACP